MIDVLNVAPDFEGRVAALESNLGELDTLFAARTVAALERETLAGPYAALVNSLRADFAARGAAALYDPHSVWTGPDGDPETVLRALALSAPPRLAPRLVVAADTAPLSVRDGVLMALTDLVDDPSGDEAALLAVTAPSREVAYSTRQMSGRVTTYVVQVGDDLRSVAEQLYGDPEAWERVITTYGLQPPYLSRTDRAGCLSPGTRLVTGESRIPAAEVGALGETMQLSVNVSGLSQDWDIVPSPGGGIATVSGELCLATDCALRLATPLGDLPEYPRYGMPEIAGQPRDTEAAAQYLLATETLQEDARVGRVLSSSRTAGLKLLANVTVVPATSETVTYVRD